MERLIRMKRCQTPVPLRKRPAYFLKPPCFRGAFVVPEVQMSFHGNACTLSRHRAFEGWSRSLDLLIRVSFVVVSLSLYQSFVDHPTDDWLSSGPLTRSKQSVFSPTTRLYGVPQCHALVKPEDSGPTFVACQLVWMRYREAA